MTQNPIIVALDVDSAQEARSLVAKLGSHVNFYKVGMELYAAAGTEFVYELIHQGKDVFLDLKMYDIPETVKRAVAQVARTGAKFLTVHAVTSVMRAAVKGRADFALKLLAVTVLTSFGPEDMADLGYTCAISELVAQRARKAMHLGMDGIVASPLEAAESAGDARGPILRRGERRPEAHRDSLGSNTRWRRLPGDRPRNHTRRGSGTGGVPDIGGDRRGLAGLKGGLEHAFVCPPAAASRN